MIDFFREHSAWADKTADLLVALLIWFLTWWLTNRSRDRVDREAEKAALRAQADALIVAVGDLRATANVNRTLWERPAEQGRTMLLAALIGGGRIVRGTRGGSGWADIAVGLGEAAQFLGRERIASKQNAATVREPLMRLTTAAAPLLRHQDPTIATAAEELFTAAMNIGTDTARADTALETFGRAVRAALEPRPNLFVRLFRRRPSGDGQAS